MDTFTTPESQLAEIGRLFKENRLANNMTQAMVAEEGAVGVSTLKRLENGQDIGLLNFLKLLQGMGMAFEPGFVLPTAPASPIDELERQRRHEDTRRQRSRPKHEKGPAETKSGWRWGDER